ELSAERLGALSHRDEAEPPRLRPRLLRLEAGAVVGDGQPQARVPRPQLDADVLRAGVFERVRERLLGDSQQAALQLGRQPPLDLDADLDLATVDAPED